MIPASISVQNSVRGELHAGQVGNGDSDVGSDSRRPLRVLVRRASTCRRSPTGPDKAAATTQPYRSRFPRGRSRLSPDPRTLVCVLATHIADCRTKQRPDLNPERRRHCVRCSRYNHLLLLRIHFPRLGRWRMSLVARATTALSRDTPASQPVGPSGRSRTVCPLLGLREWS